MGVLVLALAFNISYMDAWWFDVWPVGFLDNLVDKANEDSDGVQNTAIDPVTSNGSSCWKDSRYTFSNTLCWIRDNLYHYLQYAVYIWLAVATILIIWNSFRLVVSKDNQKEFDSFKTNLINLGIWVILLVAFYFIIDLFVSVVNLLSE